MIKRPVLRYHGGKFRMAPWIISHFPKHRVYVEPFGGAASVLLRKERAYAEVYNDKWDIVVNVFSILRNPVMAEKLERAIRLTPFSRTEFNKCGDLQISKIKDPIEKARRTIFRSFAGFGSASTNANHSTGFRSNSSRSGTTPAHDWASYPDHLKTFVERFQGVVIENKDYQSVILQHDSPETLIYMDPPYVHSSRNMQRGNAAYAVEMIDDGHSAMADFLRSVKGMVVLSGYENPLYDYLFKDWAKFKIKTFADGARPRIECLWLNDKAAAKKQPLLF